MRPLRGQRGGESRKRRGTPMNARRVAVIGGGYAGFAAAVTLAASGRDVTVFETARTLGGRARRVEAYGATIDNGQHILLGAYSQTLALLKRVHGEGAELELLDRRRLHAASRGGTGRGPSLSSAGSPATAFDAPPK